MLLQIPFHMDACLFLKVLPELSPPEFQYFLQLVSTLNLPVCESTLLNTSFYIFHQKRAKMHDLPNLKGVPIKGVSSQGYPQSQAVSSRGECSYSIPKMSCQSLRQDPFPSVHCNSLEGWRTQTVSLLCCPPADQPHLSWEANSVQL